MFVLVSSDTISLSLHLLTSVSNRNDQD